MNHTFSKKNDGFTLKNLIVSTEKRKPSYNVTKINEPTLKRHP